MEADGRLLPVPLRPLLVLCEHGTAAPASASSPVGRGRVERPQWPVIVCCWRWAQGTATLLFLLFLVAYLVAFLATFLVEKHLAAAGVLVALVHNSSSMAL